MRVFQIQSLDEAIYTDTDIATSANVIAIAIAIYAIYVDKMKRLRGP